MTTWEVTVGTTVKVKANTEKEACELALEVAENQTNWKTNAQIIDDE